MTSGNWKTVGYVAGMFILGSVLLAGVGWLMQLRMQGGPATPARIVNVEATTGRTARPGEEAARNRGLSILIHGLGVSIHRAAAALEQGRRADANGALDGARIASDVGEFAADRTLYELFRTAARAVNQARHAIQNGRPDGAIPLLRAVEEPLLSFRGSVGSASPETVSGYVGATLIDPRGSVIGEVRELRRNGSQLSAVIRLGGWFDFMGLFDFGGEERSVPAADLVFGRPRTIGSTVVVLASD